MAVLAVADHDNNTTLRDTTLKTIAAAQKISPDVDVVVLDENAQAAADAAAKIAGVRKVLLAELAARTSEVLGNTVWYQQASFDAIKAQRDRGTRNPFPGFVTVMGAKNVGLNNAPSPSSADHHPPGV